MIEPIVSAQWLHDNLGDPDLIILDVGPRPEGSEFLNAQIQSARHFDFKGEFVDKSSDFPNTLPSSEQFEQGCRALGVKKSSKLVVYDTIGVHWSPRVWWMFKVMGHEEVAVLNGGLPAWTTNGYALVELDRIEYSQGDFKASFKQELYKDYNFVKSNVDLRKEIVIDARSTGRFGGLEPEPRKGLKSGKIANSLNLPYTDLLENGHFKSKAELMNSFKALGTDDRPLVFSCGSGITACIVMLASEFALENKKAVYDGSWTEWAIKEKLID